MSSTLKGAMIGCGWFAENHRQAWLRIPGVEIVAAADQRLDRAQRFAARAYDSAEQMLELSNISIPPHGVCWALANASWGTARRPRNTIKIVTKKIFI